MNAPAPRGLIAVDKMGGKVLFLDPESYATTHVLDNFERTPHELFISPETSKAYVPIFGNGIHGRNPKPGHLLSIVDLTSIPSPMPIDPSALSIASTRPTSTCRSVAAHAFVLAKCSPNWSSSWCLPASSQPTNSSTASCRHWDRCDTELCWRHPTIWR